MFRPTIAQAISRSFLVLSLFTSFALCAGEVDDLFQTGLKAYQAHKFEDARDSFQNALNVEPANARLLHNLALTFYQLNQKSRAVALWRKALAVDPRYRAARAGRDLMESRMNMRAFERDPLDLWIERTLEYVSLFESTWLLLLALGVSGYFWIQYLARKRAAHDEQASPPPFPSLASLASVVLVTAIGLLALKLSFEFTPRATIVGDKVNAKSLPSEDGVGLFEVPGGTEVVIKNTQTGWRQIENPEGSTGWIKDADLLATSDR